MANQWGISREVEELVISRDDSCIYCGSSFSIEHKSRKTIPTWEHIINDLELISSDNIAYCCMSCNSSKGAKNVEFWFEGKYCKSKGINKDTVAEVVKNVILKSHLK